MKSQVTSYSKGYTTVFYLNGQPVQTVEGIAEDGYRYLNVRNPGVLKGDYHTPYPLDFYIDVVGNLYGTVVTEQTDGLPLQVDFGNLRIRSPRFVGTTSEADLYNKCLSDCFDQIRSPIDMSINAAQGAQVSAMVRKGFRIANYVKRFDAKSLADEFFAYRRSINRDGRARKGRSRFGDRGKATGALWLEYTYGLKPLAQDLYNTAVELGRQFPSKMVVQARSKDRFNETFRTGGLNNTQMTTDCTDEQRYLMKMRFKPLTEWYNLLSNFTSLNPASMAWELLPFSFVFDWMVDVGGYMRNMETALLAGSAFIDGFTTHTRYLNNYTYQASTVVNGSVRTTVQATGHNSFKMKIRAPLIVMPYPRPPRFKAEMGSGRLLNAAALISQHLGRR